MSPILPVNRARWCDLDLLVDLVTASLSPSSLGAWLVPDAGQRPGVLSGVVRMWTEHALLFGDAFLLRDGSAATVWFHRYRPLPLPSGYDELLAATCGEHASRFRLLDQVLAARRPVEAHNHLAFLAARPGPGGDERAEAVLAASHRWMDRLSLPAYVEARPGAHCDLYQRHGYTDRDEFLRPDGPAVHSLWRPALPQSIQRSKPRNVHRCVGRLGPARNDRMTGWTPGAPASGGPAA